MSSQPSRKDQGILSRYECATSLLRRRTIDRQRPPSARGQRALSRGDVALCAALTRTGLVISAKLRISPTPAQSFAHHVRSQAGSESR